MYLFEKCAEISRLMSKLPISLYRSLSRRLATLNDIPSFLIQNEFKTVKIAQEFLKCTDLAQRKDFLREEFKSSPFSDVQTAFEILRVFGDNHEALERMSRLLFFLFVFFFFLTSEISQAV